MTDYISRADAIEAVRKKLQDWGSYAFEDYRRGLYEAQDIIEALPSADDEPKWSCTANFVAEQLDRLRKMTDEEKWEFFRKFFGMGDAVHGWIPCSERLPSEDECGWYLVTVKGHELFVDVAPFNDELWKGLASHQKVIAWMPLPTPYKGGDGE